MLCKEVQVYQRDKGMHIILVWEKIPNTVAPGNITHLLYKILDYILPEPAMGSCDELLAGVILIGLAT